MISLDITRILTLISIIGQVSTLVLLKVALLVECLHSERRIKISLHIWKLISSQLNF